MPRLSPVRRVAAIATIVAAAAACRESDLPTPPASPVRAAAAPMGIPAPRSDRKAQGAEGDRDGGMPTPIVCTHRPVAFGSGVFGPGGGTLIVGASRLIIPGGALHDTVTISGTGGDDTTSTVRFQPEGLHFYKPAGLVLSGAGCRLPDDGAPSVVYLGPDGSVRETIPASYDPHWKAVAAPIVHFSGYAIAF